MIPEQREVLAAYSCDSSVVLHPLGQGNINATYLVEAFPTPFVLQRISEDVFPDPLVVMDNFEIVCKHLKGLNQSHSPDFMMSEPVYTQDGKLYFKDNSGGYWRAQRYVKTETVSRLDSIDQARSVGRTLAQFHLLLGELHLGKIKDPLPGFHHLNLYLEHYDCVAKNVQLETNESNQFCRLTIAKYRQQASTLEQARSCNKLHLQPIHGDPKIDNFIFTTKGEAVGLLDLDTVGAGIVYHDLGDCLRSACSTSLESDGEHVQPTFDLHLCEGILDGYFSSEITALKHIQPDYIFDGLFAICFELGLRFFTDHLQGNVYFRVKKDGENAVRALNQFRLCENIVTQEKETRQLAKRIYRKNVL